MSDVYIWTRGGNRVSLLQPTPDQIRLDDIAHALSRICRWTGHVNGEPYSVAQHSVVVSHMVPLEHAAAALLHDAHEAYVGDVASPVKRLLGPELLDLTERFDGVIGKRFGVALPAGYVVRNADAHAQRWEAHHLLGVPISEIGAHFGCADVEALATYAKRLPAPVQSMLEPLHPRAATRAFLIRARELGLCESQLGSAAE